MTPMIDIVFLLIIFFMTLPQLTRAVYRPLELPIVQKIEHADADEQLTINIDHQGNLFMGENQCTLAFVEAAVNRRMQELGHDGSRIRILIRADGRALTATVNELVDLFNRNEIKQVRISSRSSQ